MCFALLPAVDFIWFTATSSGNPVLRALQALLPPAAAALPNGMPNHSWASDHISLVADFAMPCMPL